MAQRTLACTPCHGREGRAGPDGYYPRIAGKPAGYLYNQLLNFRDGRRHYGLMARLLDPLSDAYLLEIARALRRRSSCPTPPPRAPTAARRRPGSAARLWLMQGDAARHAALLRALPRRRRSPASQPNTPGLLGVPRDYLNAQLGAWRTGQRRAHAPDCMAEIARQLEPEDLNAVPNWLAAQPLPRRRHAGGVAALATDDRLRQRIAPGRKAAAMRRLLGVVLVAALALLALVLFLNLRGEDRIHDAPPLTPPAGDNGGARSLPGARGQLHGLPHRARRRAVRRAAGRSTRRSAPCTRATSRRMPDRASATGRPTHFWRALHNGRVARRAPAVPGLSLSELHASSPAPTPTRCTPTCAACPPVDRPEHAASAALALQHAGGAGRLARALFHAGPA